MYHLIREMFEGRHIDSGAYEKRSIVKEEQRGTFGRVNITIAARGSSYLVRIARLSTPE